MIVAKSLHDHGLTHATVAVDRDVWHAGRARMLEQPVEDTKHLPGTCVLHPTFAMDRPNPAVV
jgi:hypothetical protein